MQFADNAAPDQPARAFAQADLGFVIRFQNQWILITETYLHNFDPLKPHFYIVKLGFTGVYNIFSYFCSKTKIVGTR